MGNLVSKKFRNEEIVELANTVSEAVWRPQRPRRSKIWDYQGNMRIDIRVIEVTDIKSVVIFDL